MQFKKKIGLCLMVVSALSANLAYAAGNARGHTSQPRHDIVGRQTEKVKTDTGFTRSTKLTNSAGETATRQTDVVVDKVNGTRTRDITGTRFDGTTYSGESVAHKTETGYSAQGHLTDSSGKTVERSVDAVVDKNAGTLTKTISTTPNNGETTTRTVVKSLHHQQGS